jgi:hypothetical protein
MFGFVTGILVWTILLKLLGKRNILFVSDPAIGFVRGSPRPLELGEPACRTQARGDSLMFLLIGA